MACGVAIGDTVRFGGEGAKPFLFLLQDMALPAFLRENPEDDFGIGGSGTSEYGLPWGSLHSSLDEGAVEIARSREELSVVETVFELDAPLPLKTLSQ